jgi:hypothetical protein
MSMVAPRRAKDEDEEEDTDDKKMETPEETTPVLVRVPLTLTKQISDLSF